MTNTAPGAAFAADLGQELLTDEDTPALKQRVQGLIRGLLATHINALQALMAEAGVAEAEQGWRMDRLVRGLRELQFDAQLAHNGRPLAVQMDAQATPPLIQLNRSLLAGIEDAEILRALHAPIADILGISAVGVALVLTCSDERLLKQLINQVTRRPGVRCIPLTRVPAIVEQRVELFESRLEAVAEHFGEVVFWLYAGRDDFIAAICSDYESWPRWEQIQDTDYIARLIVEVSDGLTACSKVPRAHLLVELCWESLELSPTAFLRHAAQQLRAHQSAANLHATLTAFCRFLYGPHTDQFTEETTAAWPIFGELNAIWHTLYPAEQRILPGHTAPSAAPPIPAFELPHRIFGVNEPADLPWDVPLLAWTLREVEGLRDLLAGFCHPLQQLQPAREAPPFTPRTPRGAPTEPALTVGEDPPALRVQVLWRGHEWPANYAELRARAFAASQAQLISQFQRLTDAGRQRVLRTLRAAYDGYFGEARAVWARRLQAWKAWEPTQAFETLSSELSHVFGHPMLFDPFAAPTSLDTPPAPSFILVAARPIHAPGVTTHLPLAALRQTTRGASVRIRVVDVPQAGACAWAGDLAVTMAMVEEHPIRVALDAIQNDSLRLLVSAPGAS